MVRSINIVLSSIQIQIQQKYTNCGFYRWNGKIPTPDSKSPWKLSQDNIQTILIGEGLISAKCGQKTNMPIVNLIG